MKRSSAQQLELNYSTSAGSSDNERFASAEAQSPNDSTAPAFPTFENRGEVYALTSRIAGRINASNVSAEEHEALLKERQSLLDKKLGGKISKTELNRLEYVRWSLDRIEDAKYGQVLDGLEAAVARYEGFLEEASRLKEQLDRYAAKRK